MSRRPLGLVLLAVAVVGVVAVRAFDLQPPVLVRVLLVHAAVLGVTLVRRPGRRRRARDLALRAVVVVVVAAALVH